MLYEKLMQLSPNFVHWFGRLWFLVAGNG